MNRTISESELTDILDFVGSLNQHEGAVVVEGQRDSEALCKIGYRGNILIFHQFGGLAEFADVAARYARVIVLFDADRTGRYLTRRLADMLRRRTRVDTTFKRKLARITRGRVRCVEQLAQYGTHLDYTLRRDICCTKSINVSEPHASDAVNYVAARRP